MSAQFPQAFSVICKEIQFSVLCISINKDKKMASGGFRSIPQFSQVSHSTPLLKASENCIAPEDQLLAAGPTKSLYKYYVRH